MKLFVKISLLILCAALAQSCSVIDDDLSVCEKEPNLELHLDLTLHTELELEVNTRLEAEIYKDIRPLIVDALSDIFSDQAHDIEALFYYKDRQDTARHIKDIINSNQKTYPIYLPANDYDAIALANIDNNGIVSVEGFLTNASANFVVERKDTIDSQRTGLFRAARTVEVINENNEQLQVIEMHLKQVNGAVVLVVDTTDYQPLDIKAIVTETASGMMISDSLFLFERNIVVRADKLYIPNIQHANVVTDEESTNEEGKFACLTAVTMPSRDTADENGTFFTVKVYVKLKDGTITENTLSVKEQLPAGQIVIIKLKMADQGVITPVEDSQVGATVKLDWKPGSEHEIEL